MWGIGLILLRIGIIAEFDIEPPGSISHGARAKPTGKRTLGRPGRRMYLKEINVNI